MQISAMDYFVFTLSTNYDTAKVSSTQIQTNIEVRLAEVSQDQGFDFFVLSREDYDCYIKAALLQDYT